MKASQGGFLWLPILIVLGLIAISGGVYFVMHQNATPQQTQTQQATNAPGMRQASTPTVASTNPSAAFNQSSLTTTAVSELPTITGTYANITGDLAIVIASSTVSLPQNSFPSSVVFKDHADDGGFLTESPPIPLSEMRSYASPPHSGTFTDDIVPPLQAGIYAIGIYTYHQNPTGDISKKDIALLTTGTLTVNAETGIPSARIDQNSLTSTSRSVTITGSASNIKEVWLDLQDTSVGQWAAASSPVVNGRWSATILPLDFGGNTASVGVVDANGDVLASGIVTVEPPQFSAITVTNVSSRIITVQYRNISPSALEIYPQRNGNPKPIMTVQLSSAASGTISFTLPDRTSAGLYIINPVDGSGNAIEQYNPASGHNYPVSQVLYISPSP